MTGPLRFQESALVEHYLSNPSPRPPMCGHGHTGSRIGACENDAAPNADLCPTHLERVDPDHFFETTRDEVLT